MPSKIRESATYPQRLVGPFGQVSELDSFGAGEKTAVDCIDNRLSGDLMASEETAIQTLDGVLAALDSVKFEVNVALRVRI